MKANSRGQTMSKKRGLKKRQANEIPRALKCVDIPAVLRRRGWFMKQRFNQELKVAALPLAAKLIKKQRAGKKKSAKTVIQMPQKYASFADDVVAEYKGLTVSNVEGIEKHFDEAVRKFLINEVLAKALSKLHGIVDENKGVKAQKKALEVIAKADVFSADDEAELASKATLNLEPILQNMGVIAGQDANKLIGVGTPYVLSDALKKRIRENVDKFTQSMIETDQKHLSDLIVAGIDAGQSVQEISSTLRSDFSDYSKNQSTRITRTEVLRSANQGAVDAFKQSGVVSGKQWVIAGAEDECANLDGEIVTLDSGFYGAEGDFQDGDPPLHPNCKCVVIPVLVDESDQGS